MKNIILCGYNWSACKALELLLERRYNIYVYTHKSEWYINDLESFCIRKKIPYSLEKISISNLPFKPDLICSIYYRNIISKDIIDHVSKNIINLHPSLLPNYRGCSSLTWALINGEKEVGFTYHFIDQEVDTGNIIIQKKEKVYDFDTQQSLYYRVMFNGLNYFYEAIDLVFSGYKGKPQEGETSFYKRGCPHKGELNKSWPLDYKERFIRAMINPPLPRAKIEQQ